jgi:multiple antibiotic resistance protein
MPQGEAPALIGLGAMFTLFFVTLGPLKVLGPFVQLTQGLDERTMRRIALLAFGLGVVAVLGGGVLGRVLLTSWQISVPSMLLAGGIIFLLVGLDLVLAPYKPAPHAPDPLPAQPLAAAMRVTFPTVVTPYGIAAFIVVLANSRHVDRTVNVFVLVLGVMLLNLAAMVYARRIMRGAGALVLQILGAVLGVLQVALATEMIRRGLQELGMLAA